MELNDRLIQLRKENKMTQADLAEELHLSRQAISRWETGVAVPSSENFLELSRVYSVPVDSIMRESAVLDNRIEGVRKDDLKERINSNGRWTKKSIAAIVVAVVIVAAVSVFTFAYSLNTKDDSAKPIRIEDTEEDKIKDFSEVGIFSMEED